MLKKNNEISGAWWKIPFYEVFIIQCLNNERNEEKKYTKMNSQVLEWNERIQSMEITLVRINNFFFSPFISWWLKGHNCTFYQLPNDTISVVLICMKEKITKKKHFCTSVYLIFFLPRIGELNEGEKKKFVFFCSWWISVEYLIEFYAFICWWMQRASVMHILCTGTL